MVFWFFTIAEKKIFCVLISNEKTPKIFLKNLFPKEYKFKTILLPNSYLFVVVFKLF